MKKILSIILTSLVVISLVFCIGHIFFYYYFGNCEVNLMNVLYVFLPSLFFVIYALLMVNGLYKNKKRIQIVLGLMVVVITLANYFYISSVYKDYTNSLFIRDKWIANEQDRSLIVKNMAKVINLKKLNKQQVLAILGEPTVYEQEMPYQIKEYEGLEYSDLDKYKDYFTYSLGDYNFLRIYFDNNRVKAYVLGWFAVTTAE